MYVDVLPSYLENSNLMTKIDTTLHADPNNNYDIFASEIFYQKNIFSETLKNSINGSTKKEKWMTDDLLTLVKKELYKE